jgi:D-alanyl-D-alanine carboxypeptidase
MRSLLAENLEKASTRRTVAAITERNPTEANTDVADADDAAPTPPAAPVAPSAAVLTTPQPRPAAAASLMSQARAEVPTKIEPKSEPAPLTSGVIQTQAIAAIPGSSEPMKPVKVKTVQIKAGQVKLAAAGPAQPAPSVTSAIPARTDVPETSSAVVAKAEIGKPESGTADTGATKVDTSRTDLPPQPANHGTGNGILGVLPASSLSSPSPSQALAYADPSPRTPQPQSVQPSKPEVIHTGWIIQVGALESESEARQRIEAARNQAHGLLNKADPFTEPVVAKGDKKLFRARFAGLDRDQAEAVCRALKRSEISCITIRN